MENSRQEVSWVIPSNSVGFIALLKSDLIGAVDGSAIIPEVVNPDAPLIGVNAIEVRPILEAGEVEVLFPCWRPILVRLPERLDDTSQVLLVGRRGSCTTLSAPIVEANG